MCDDNIRPEQLAFTVLTSTVPNIFNITIPISNIAVPKIM